MDYLYLGQTNPGLIVPLCSDFHCSGQNCGSPFSGDCSGHSCNPLCFLGPTPPPCSSQGARPCPPAFCDIGV